MTKLRLSELNARVSSSNLLNWLTLAVFVFTLAVFLAPHVLRRDLNAPPEVGDAPHYEAIALQASRGQGFSVNWDDPQFKAPYLTQNDDGRYSFLYDWHGQGVTAYRPPLLPILMAAIYKIFGRNFALVRAMNMTFMALAIVLIFMLIVRRYGVIPGLLFTALTVLFDFRSRFYASLILTEALACLLTTATLWCLLRTVETKRRKWAFILGVVTGLAFLARTVFFFWMPPIALTVFALTRPNGERWLGLRSLRLSLLFIAVFTIVALPWMLRNCLVLHRFQPLGTQGALSLISGYSDKAIELKGVWFNPDQFGMFDHLSTQGKPPLEQELIKGDYSRSEAYRWIVQNPSKIPRLAVLKVLGEWQPANFVQALLLGFAGLGFLVLLALNWQEAVSCFTFLGTATLAVALTYSADGRFLIPFLPLLTMLSTLGIWSFVLSSAELPLDRLSVLQLQAGSTNTH
jgi:4-amino-4-deoxy-L-arabinose transferase-like glycosyltransferase